RNSFVPNYIRVSKENPGVGRYTIHWNSIDSEKFSSQGKTDLTPPFLSLPRIDDPNPPEVFEKKISKRSNPLEFTLKGGGTHKVDPEQQQQQEIEEQQRREKSERRKREWKIKEAQDASARLNTSQGGINDPNFFITQMQHSDSGDKLRKMEQWKYQKKMTPDGSAQSGSPSSTSKQTRIIDPNMSSSFKSTSPQRASTVYISSCKEDFYVNHDSNIEVDSLHPRVTHPPISKMERGSKASLRVHPDITDHIYNMKYEAVQVNSNPVLSDLDKEVTRERSIVWASTSGKGGQSTFSSRSLSTGSGGMSYNPNDQMQSKRPKIKNAMLTFNLGSPAPCTR
ncbi:MAG: hypothetical protein EZS28_050106, partial [Streblomastix strix]